MQKQEELGVQFGKYRVFAKLAVGGMAELFLAKQPGIGGFQKTVVLKCILSHLAQEADFLQMFLDEARIASPLNHPNIVQIYEIGEQAGVYYIAMEYIRGQNLREFRQRLYRHHPDVRPYNLCAGILAQVAAGLHYAHTALDDHGHPLLIVHRDVSPTNLLLSYNGVVKLVDFGVAKATSQQHQTSAGTIKGKYRYMSPEQIRGQDLDQRSDVFSLGIVLYELSTNVGLFGRQHDAEVIDAVRNARVTAPSKYRADYPKILEEIVMMALALDPNDRFQTADEMRAALEVYMREENLYYGTAQLAELMQFLFPNEQMQSHTGTHLLPLSPTDFVRFLGEIPGTPYSSGMSGIMASPVSGSHPSPVSGNLGTPVSGSRPAPGRLSDSADEALAPPQHLSLNPSASREIRHIDSVRGTGSGETVSPKHWPGDPASSALKTPTSSHQIRSSSEPPPFGESNGIGVSPAPVHARGSSSPDVANPFNVKATNSYPSIPSPSRSGILSPSLSGTRPSPTRDEVLEDSGLRSPASAFDTFEVDERMHSPFHNTSNPPHPEDQPTDIFAAEHDLASDTNPSMPALREDKPEDPDWEPTPLRRQKSRIWPVFLLLGGILGGVVTAYALGLFSRQHSSESLQEQQRIIQKHIQDKQYETANRLLQKFQVLSLDEPFRIWAEKTQLELTILPQLALAQQRYREQKYIQSREILRRLLRLAPDHAGIRSWLDRVAEAIAAQERNQRTTPPPERRDAVSTTDTPSEPVIRRPTRRRTRPTRRRPRSRHNTKVAMQLPHREDPTPVREGFLHILSQPTATASVAGKTESTPWRVTLPEGRYKLSLSRTGYQPKEQWVEVRTAQTTLINLTLDEIEKPQPRIAARRTPPVAQSLEPDNPPTPEVRRDPPARPAPKAFRVNLPKQVSLRIFISDPRGIGGLQYTTDLQQMAQNIERQVGALLDEPSSVVKITQAWQRYVRERATQANEPYVSFSPRAVAYVIFSQLQQGRASRRVSQLLVKYERFKKFRQYQNR